MAAEHVAKRLTSKPVWIEGVGWHLDSAHWTNRDLVYPRYVEYAARMAYDMAGIREPRKEIHIAEPYDPFDYKALHHLEGLGLADRGKAVELYIDGTAAKDGNMPVCPSGGLLGVGNPIAAAGLMKIAELPGSLSEALRLLSQDDVLKDALGSSIYESFTRAKAESVGGLKSCTVGIAERQEKLFVMICASLFLPWFPNTPILNYAMILIGVLSSITVIQRLVYTWKETGGN
jgi:hypothetical protein